MSEQALLTFWESFINELGSITNDLSDAINTNSASNIIGEYNRFPKVFNEKLLVEFEHIINKIKEEKRIDSEITKRFKQLELVFNTLNLSESMVDVIYDICDTRELVERLTKDLIQEKNKNNKISHLKTQINANKIKSNSVLNTDSRDAILKQIKRDEHSLEALFNNEEEITRTLDQEIRMLKAKLETASVDKDFVLKLNEELREVTSNLEKKANDNEIETIRKDIQLSNMTSELNNCKTIHDQIIVAHDKVLVLNIDLNTAHDHLLDKYGHLLDKYDQAVKDIVDLNDKHIHNTKIIDNFDAQKLDLNTAHDQLLLKYDQAIKDIIELKHVHVYNTQIIDNFDIQNLTKYKENISKNLVYVKQSKTIQNIQQLLMSKKIADAKRLCTKSVANDFVGISEIDDLVTNLNTMIDSFKSLKDTVSQHNEHITNQLNCVYK